MGLIARWVFHLALAYALLGQTVLGGVASAQHELAAASGALCQGQTQQAPDDGGRHDALCCQLGCVAAAGPVLLDPPAGAQPNLPQARLARIHRAAADTAAPVRVHLSFAARGPPVRG